MTLSRMLGEAELTAEHMETKAEVTLEKQSDGFAITSVHLTLAARIPGVDSKCSPNWWAWRRWAARFRSYSMRILRWRRRCFEVSDAETRRPGSCSAAAHLSAVWFGRNRRTDRIGQHAE
jgi:hypothetical protein